METASTSTSDSPTTVSRFLLFAPLSPPLSCETTPRKGIELSPGRFRRCSPLRRSNYDARACWKATVFSSATSCRACLVFSEPLSRRDPDCSPVLPLPPSGSFLSCSRFCSPRRKSLLIAVAKVTRDTGFAWTPSVWINWISRRALTKGLVNVDQEDESVPIREAIKERRYADFFPLHLHNFCADTCRWSLEIREQTVDGCFMQTWRR